MTTSSISSLLQEHRVFPPPAELAARAQVRSLAEYETLYRRAADQPDDFWAEQARQLDWATPWSRVLDWEPPDARWFVDGTLNVAWNCLDRHLTGPRRNKAAILF